MPQHSDSRPVVLVVDDLAESYRSLEQQLRQHDHGRLAEEFDYVHLTCYADLESWYGSNRGRFVSLIVQDVDFSHIRDDGKLLSYPQMMRPPSRAFDARALQGFIIYAYLRHNDLDRTVPVVFVSARIGLESTREFASFLSAPGYGNCTFVPESGLGPQYYPRIIGEIDAYALRPLGEEERRSWREGDKMVMGRARKMAYLAREIKRIGPSDATVLLMGSPGVGKELVALALHRRSNQYSSDHASRRQPLTVNMTTLTKTILEDELFGHEKGAFTGASTEREGLFEAARGSTAFLDEIGDVDEDTQVKLLRAMEYHLIRRVGSSTEREVEIRIIAATNRTVEELQSKFRSDFYSRLVQHCIPVPSLKDRWAGEPRRVIEQDLEELFCFVIDEMNQNPRHERQLRMEQGAVRFCRQVVDEYIDGGNRIFEGNIRTLRNLIERAYERAMYDGSNEVGVGHVISTLGMLQHLNPTRNATATTGALTIEAAAGTLNLDEISRKAIIEALARAGHNQSKAADMLGVHRDTLRRKIQEYRIDTR